MVEVEVLPLIAAMESQIDREHFISIIAQKLNIPDTAVRAEVAKRPGTEVKETSPEVHTEDAELRLSAVERIAGMLLTHDDGLRTQVKDMLGPERLAAIEANIEPHSERLRFEFDAQGEDAESVVKDLLVRVEQAALSERIENLKKTISDARAEGGSTVEFTKELQDLKVREEALRK